MIKKNLTLKQQYNCSFRNASLEPVGVVGCMIRASSHRQFMVGGFVVGVLWQKHVSRASGCIRLWSWPWVTDNKPSEAGPQKKPLLVPCDFQRPQMDTSKQSHLQKFCDYLSWKTIKLEAVETLILLSEDGNRLEGFVKRKQNKKDCWLVKILSN